MITVYIKANESKYVDWFLKMIEEKSAEGECLFHDYGNQPYGSRKIGIRPYNKDKIVQS